MICSKWNSSGFSVDSMSQLNLADPLMQRMPLAPREAATLTIQRHAGFGLIERLLVIALIGIIVAIAVPGGGAPFIA